ncbi:MAG: c-type cytochrome [Bacteroidia bacterium]|jgi:cytochrome c oxidase subunit 2|nr:c-type cytochrome [Bacteroidia bacterium]
MRIITTVLHSFFLVSLLSFSVAGFAQTVEEGEKLFNANCTSCHAINEKVVGPALKNTHTKHKEDWYIKWVKNSQKMVKSGDAMAVQLYKENNEALMTSFENLSDVQIKSIIAYVKAESEKQPVATASVAPSSSTDSASMSASGENPYKTKTNWMLAIVAVLLILVIGQVFGILSRIGEIQGRPAINWGSINGKLLLAFLIVGMGAAIWEFFIHGKLTVNAQDAASIHGEEYDSMFNITLLITGIVFIITQILLFWYGYRYRNDGKRKAIYYPDNHKLELIWTVIPAIVLTILVIRGLKTWNHIMNSQDEKAAIVEVYGYQFGWNARYAGTDNKLGNHDFRQIGVVNALGVDPKDPKAQDDVIVNELHFPVGKPVSLKFRAKDVIHSAYLPHFRVQMNVVPGLPTQFNFTPTITTAEMRNKLNNPKFDYVLLCNKICGGAHYRMKMKVVVDTPEEYAKWLATQPTLGASTAPATESTDAQASINSTETVKTIASK